MHIAEVVTIAKSLPLLRLNTYKSLILSYSADYRRIFRKNTASPPGEDDFSAKPEGSRPCRPKRSVCQLCPVVPGLPMAVYALFPFRPCSRYPCPHKVWNTKQGRSWGQPCSARYYSGLYAAFVSFPDIVAGGIRIPGN